MINFHLNFASFLANLTIPFLWKVVLVAILPFGYFFHCTGHFFHMHPSRFRLTLYKILGLQVWPYFASFFWKIHEWIWNYRIHFRLHSHYSHSWFSCVLHQSKVEALLLASFMTFFWSWTQCLELELRQYKNDSIHSKRIPVLKFPLFFLRRVTVWF